MRFPLLLSCAVLIATAIASAGAADVWVEGRWENSNGQYQWRAGYWQTATATTTTVVQAPPAQVWVEGRWAQGANGWVWVEGHYENAPTPPQPVVVQQPVIVQQPPVVVVERPCPPPVVVSANVGYGYSSYGYSNYGYGYRAPCPPPAPVYCPPRRPVVCAPAPVYCPPRPVVCPPVYSGGVRVNLPKPSLAFPTVKVGSHRLPLPPIPVFKR